MIETNETGQEQIRDLLKGMEDECWTEWESDFISSLTSKSYSSLTARQKSVITSLYEKWINQ
jgi:hypothetical protein